MAIRTPHKMTAEEATTFDRQSVANAVRVTELLSCGCEPYKDVFTYLRWRAQGMQVQRGEKSIRLPLIIERQADDDDDDSNPAKLLRRSAVFCRHQVQPTTKASP